MPQTTPTGDLMLRLTATPSDLNRIHLVFGGWLFSQMDIAGSIKAAHYTSNRIVTAAADQIAFHSPGTLQDWFSVYAHCLHKGHTSLKIAVEIWAQNTVHSLRPVASGQFVFVAIDDSGKPTAL